MRSSRLCCVSDGMICGSNNFGILRLVLALAVVVSHAFSVATGRLDAEPLMHATGFTLGEHAVNGFFAISGFLVTMSYERRGWRDYGLARLLRIVPGLVAATLFVSLVIGTVMTSLDWASYFADGQLWRFIQGTLTTFKSAAALPGVFDQNPLSFPMGTVWTLKYECLCYLGVLGAGLAGLLCRRNWVLCLWVLLLAAVILREIIAPNGAKGVETGLRLPLIFVTGGVIYLWRERVPLSVWGLCGLAVLVTLLARTPLYKAALFSGTAWGAIVLALAPALTAWRSTPEADLSYGVYLYGWPVQQVFYALFPAAGALTLLAPSLLLTLLLAAASWYAVERPALGLKRRLLCG
ncbi:Peptidoglycan/LPS O-acetylase OafA/YrhL, contains acyltransferase and SGNH-hydrolase domains [Bosea sp. OK403]|uniref:acyltransferase family protein n=1 Tax=Bosea sp. OK403 TaxID=1855286 RepID=UPI0008ECC946|nr:acyltransferase [Bosea sp. OK403]SFI03086.1 Peptidoglycan/LPS O-acetylase OafA/YrhL, contains acyltransferase and SGNH-hydrolase domains [Bosea sp. OK403]